MGVMTFTLSDIELWEQKADKLAQWAKDKPENWIKANNKRFPFNKNKVFGQGLGFCEIDTSIEPLKGLYGILRKIRWGKPSTADVLQKKLRIEALHDEIRELKEELRLFRPPAAVLKAKEKKELTKWDADQIGKYALFRQRYHADSLEKAVPEKEKEIKELEKELTKVKDDSWKAYCLPKSETERREILNLVVDSLYLREDAEMYSAGKLYPRKKQRPEQKHRDECRNVADKLWKEDPSITIVDMAHREEINAVFGGKTYTEKTIREWIKDRCPNRLPGRRRKNKICQR